MKHIRRKKGRQYWLMKSEPATYSIDDLEQAGRACWEGVRNYQARNFMRDDMRVGDLALFYHSNTKPPGVAGVAEIWKESYPDHTCWDKKSEYHDPTSSKENPRWFMVDVSFVRRFDPLISLQELRDTPALSEMMVLQKGMRLSVQPVTEDDFFRVLDLRR